MLIYPYRKGSKSVKALRENGFKSIKLENSRFKGRSNKVVINYGSSSLPPEVLKCRVINSPEAVSKAANKLSSFKAMAEYGVSVPRFTEDAREALGWDSVIVVRHKLTGHSGEGIELFAINGGRDIPPAPLYVEYIKKKEEYRVHVFMGEVIDIQRKARKREVPDEEVNWQVRNLDGGFIYAREGVELPEEAHLQAIAAVEALGLDFGAVDIIWNERSDTYYVLEVNTAPGLTGTTLEKYVEAFKQL
jgi:glutathione synthase/RimK-type ligase-like ATP-grasp enzyme